MLAAPGSMRLCYDHGQPWANCTGCDCDLGWSGSTCSFRCISLGVTTNPATLCNKHGTPYGNLLCLFSKSFQTIIVHTACVMQNGVESNASIKMGADLFAAIREPF